jgi:light-regulated signal transduction histidine kinase (bacteriophytochrome)
MVMRDNTERRAAQEAAESRNAELTRKNRELEEFAYAASHDLQEPLRMVNIYSELLLQLIDLTYSEKARQYAAYITSGVHRMEALINDLLGYSRVVHDDYELSHTADCSSAVRAAMEVLQDRIRQAGAIVSYGELPTVIGEERHISVVFQNLLSNSLKYKSNGNAPRISISAKREGPNWLFTLTDNGIGFAPEYAERIFGLFKRLHKDSYPGTGLGLAICRQIVERYGGRIWATSEGDGAGTTLFVTLRAAAS